MDICGIVAEYNPLHNGHIEQLSAIRRQLGRDAGIMVCMSGPFCQSGVPALLDKSVRTGLALKAGADLVLELSQAFAAASAERFAEGAVETLLATGVLRSLAYGTESPHQAASIRALGEFFASEPSGFRAMLQQDVASGMGFAAARADAAARFIEGADRLLASPNTILAVEYEKALFRAGHPEKIQTIATPLFDKANCSSRRIRDIVETVLDPESGTILPESYASLVFSLGRLLPPGSAAAVVRAAILGRGLLTESMTAGRILLSPVFQQIDRLREIRDMQGGLAERIIGMLHDAPGTALTVTSGTGSDGSSFIRRAATRAFPASRVRRAMLAAAFEISRGDPALTSSKPQYIRVLGFSKRGRRILSFMRRCASLPVIMNASQLRTLPATDAAAQARLDLYAQAFWNDAAGMRDADEFKRTPVIL